MALAQQVLKDAKVVRAPGCLGKSSSFGKLSAGHLVYSTKENYAEEYGKLRIMYHYLHGSINQRIYIYIYIHIIIYMLWIRSIV